MKTKRRIKNRKKPQRKIPDLVVKKNVRGGTGGTTSLYGTVGQSTLSLSSGGTFNPTPPPSKSGETSGHKEEKPESFSCG
jgi:hypothetical protein